MDVRALSEAIMPALAMDTVCRRDRGGELRCSVVSLSKSTLLDKPHLLLHDFVQNSAGGVGHFVKLVDAAHTAVAEHQSTGFQHNLRSRCTDQGGALRTRDENIATHTCTSPPPRKNEPPQSTVKRSATNLSCFWVLCHISCQTDSGRALARCVDAARCQLDGVLQQLRFAGTGVAAQQNVDL